MLSNVPRSYWGLPHPRALSRDGPFSPPPLLGVPIPVTPIPWYRPPQRCWVSPALPQGVPHPQSVTLPRVSYPPAPLLSHRTPPTLLGVPTHASSPATGCVPPVVCPPSLSVPHRGLSSPPRCVPRHWVSPTVVCPLPWCVPHCGVSPATGCHTPLWVVPRHWVSPHGASSPSRCVLCHRVSSPPQCVPRHGMSPRGVSLAAERPPAVAALGLRGAGRSCRR